VAKPENSGIFQQNSVRTNAGILTAMKEPAGKHVVPIPVDQRARALAHIRTAMIEKKMTQAELADAADCHEKTVQNMLGGRSVRDQTLFDVCMVLGLDFEEVKDQWHGSVAQSGSGTGSANGSAYEMREGATERRATGGSVAPLYMGAYTKDAVDHYFGSYLTLRADFTESGVVVAYRTEVTWDGDWPSLLFQEYDRADAPYSHRGRIYVPASSMFIHLVSLTKGAMRMIVVSQIDRDGLMRGLITTLNKQRASYVPVATPIIYAKLDGEPEPAYGRIAPGHAVHARYQAMLGCTISEGYARLVPPL
jgi:DNA-binding Xre family transcriptional regulator